jgi:hypothetical protein
MTPARRPFPKIGALLVAALALSAQSAPAPASWYRLIAEDGAVVGHGSQQIVQGPSGRETIDVQELLLAEPGDPATRVIRQTTTREGPGGRPLTISDYSQTGRRWVRTEARIGPSRAEITRSTKSDRHMTRVALPPGTRFDNGAALLRTWDPAVTPRLAFDNFNLAAMLVEHVVIEPAPASPPGGFAVLRKRYDGGELRGVARILLDRDRRIVSTSQPMFGSSVTTVPSDREAALAPHPPYRVLASVMVKSPFRIASAASVGHIRYRFGFRDGIAFAMPETGEQRVAGDADGATVDICAECGPGLPSDPATLAAALRPTAWLQSSHPRITAIAASVTRLRVPAARKMELLTDQARGYLGRPDFTGHYSALETLERRAGDCTEAAVLLAALGRAAGIPTRVVNGMVYSRERYHGVSNVFLPHSWVVAWVGNRWRSYDSALERFDSTHVALTVGDGDLRSLQAASQLAGLLRWDAMGEVKVSRAP